jgi:hypothetical protein
MKTRQQKKLAEQRLEFRLWKRWRRERVESLLVGPYAESAQALLDFFQTKPSPSSLIDFIAAGPWEKADADIRFEILALVDTVIMKRRERMGLAPFDDALPGRPLNVFLILRERLALSDFPPDGGATRGEARFNQTSNPPKHEFYHEHSNSK